MSQINVTAVDEQAFDPAASGMWKPEEIPQLTVDVYRNEDNIFVVSTVAGVSPEDLDISIENKTLIVKGIRHRPFSEADATVLLEECFWGEFYRELTINENLDVDKIKATMSQGLLIIQIPILKVAPHKKIVVDFQV